MSQLLVVERQLHLFYQRLRESRASSRIHATFSLDHYSDIPTNANLFLRNLGSKERILRLRLRLRLLLPGLLLRLPLLQDFKSGPVLALIADDLESSRLVQETITA